MSDVLMSDVLEDELSEVEEVEADCEVVVSVFGLSEVVDVRVLVGELSSVVVSEGVWYGVDIWDVDESDVVKSELMLVVDDLTVGGGSTNGGQGSVDIRSLATYRFNRLRPPQKSAESPAHLVEHSVSGTDAVPLPRTTPQ
ncbi:MAG: hypothetical protein Q9226_001611 [Calogaya cf. arnoldii]